MKRILFFYLILAIGHNLPMIPYRFRDDNPLETFLVNRFFPVNDLSPPESVRSDGGQPH